MVSFTRGADEIKFLSEFLKMIPALAVGVPSNLEPFFSRLLNYRAASSLFAIEQSLQRLKLRFESQIGFSETASIDSDIDQPESDSDLDEVDLSTPPDLDEWTTERTSGLLVVEQLLEALDKVTSDEKLKATKRLIRLIVDSRTDRMPKICIFSTYADTVLYLHSATDDLGINLFKATGVSRLADRQAAISQFLEQGGLLIGTNAGLEGTTLEQVTHVIHYDLPSDPRALDQRVGRFDRYGRGEPYTAYVLRDGSGVIDFEVTSVDSIVSLDRTKIRG
ncbi:MAG: C-terminal helicase domain-containing protein [Proteobacteria bacterium]|nr:C-terminal helicase domain-containing protein [Pseudomonadota bacterium]